MIDWKNPLVFTYTNDTRKSYPARVISKDRKNGSGNQSHIILVEKDGDEHVYTVTEQGCGSKGCVANCKVKQEVSVLFYSYKGDTGKQKVYSADITAYKHDPYQYFGGEMYARNVVMHEVIHKEFEV